MSKMQNLQQALNATTGKSAKPDPVRAPKAQRKPDAAPRQPTRVGQVNISAWLDPHFKSALRLVQARKGPESTIQELIAEALNDLFVKYDVPTVRQD